MPALKLIIREIRPGDCPEIARAFAGQGWHKPIAQFQRYLAESACGQRCVLIAELEGQFAGYLTVVWNSAYAFFREAGIPEIVDLNVLIKYQRRGVASALLEEAERRIAGVSVMAGIGVGLTADYGAAQILYIKRGYIPDGQGVCADQQPLQRGQAMQVGDHLALYFIKLLIE